MRAPHLLTLLLTAAGLLTLPDARAREIRNVILFIGDGMGSEHLHATERWTGAPLGFRSFPAATTFAARGVVTDSAAAATAMATGRKVNRFVLSQAPGNGADVPTVLEILRRRGKRHRPAGGGNALIRMVHRRAAEDAEQIYFSLDTLGGLQIRSGLCELGDSAVRILCGLRAGLRSVQLLHPRGRGLPFRVGPLQIFDHVG